MSNVNRRSFLLGTAAAAAQAGVASAIPRAGARAEAGSEATAKKQRPEHCHLSLGSISLGFCGREWAQQLHAHAEPRHAGRGWNEFHARCDESAGLCAFAIGADYRAVRDRDWRLAQRTWAERICQQSPRNCGTQDTRRIT